MSQFDRQLAAGKVGESEIAGWFKARGAHVLPIYEVEKGQYAGPSLYTASGGSLIAPDMLCFDSSGKISWIEAKHKTAFSWHRKTQRFVTGIDLHHYEQYLEISELVDWPVFLLFLQRGGTAKDSERIEPGLFGGRLDHLRTIENHRHQNWGKSGMVYWAQHKLTKYDTYPFTRFQAAMAS